VVDHYANSLAAAGVEVGPLVPGCIALYHAYRVSGDRESEYVTMHANIGDDNTDIILVREGSLLFARSLPIGLNAFLDRLQPDIGGDRDSIRQVLFSEVDLRPSIAAENLNEDRAISAAQEVAARVIQQISSSVMLAKSALRAPALDPRRIMLSGPGAAIPGLRELMMNRVRKTVEVFNPFANIDLEGVDEQTRDSVKAYRPALALAVGLAAMNTDQKLERAQFLPGTVRRRRAFLHKALPLYLSAAAVIMLVVPLFVFSSRAAAEVDDERLKYQQGPLGRYTAASSEIETLRGSLERAQKRAEASVVAAMPGRAATDVLVEFAKVRPDSVRMRSVRLETDTSNPERAEDFEPATRLRFEFFIERRPGLDPHEVNSQLRQVLLALPRVKGVIAGSATDEPAAQGLIVVQTVELRVGGEYTGGEQ
jgi:cell division ATPase FtsA